MRLTQLLKQFMERNSSGSDSIFRKISSEGHLGFKIVFESG